MIAVLKSLLASFKRQTMTWSEILTRRLCRVGHCVYVSDRYRNWALEVGLLFTMDPRYGVENEGHQETVNRPKELKFCTNESDMLNEPHTIARAVTHSRSTQERNWNERPLYIIYRSVSISDLILASRFKLPNNDFITTKICSFSTIFWKIITRIFLLRITIKHHCWTHFNGFISLYIRR